MVGYCRINRTFTCKIECGEKGIGFAISLRSHAPSDSEETRALLAVLKWVKRKIVDLSPRGTYYREA